MLSCVINTIALAADADRISSGGRPYSERVWLLRNVILPWYHSLGIFSEIVVVGEFEPGPYHTYVPCKRPYKNEADPLVLRAAGFDALKRGKDSDWVLFQHDDHLWAPTNPLPGAATDMVLSPARMVRGTQGQFIPLNDGSATNIIDGHALLVRRSVAKRVSWASIPPMHTWDHEYTAALKAAGIPWRYAPEYVVLDIERGADVTSATLPQDYLFAPPKVEDLLPYRSGSTEPWTAELVCQLAKSIRATLIVETGTYQGLTTLALWNALKDQPYAIQIHSVEADVERFKAAGRFLQGAQGMSTNPACGITLHHGDALGLLDAMPGGSADLIFLDDDHEVNHVRAELCAALRVLRPRGVLLFHDVCGSIALSEVVQTMGGVVLDLPRLHSAGGLGILVKP